MTRDDLHRLSLRRTLILVLLAGVFVGGIAQAWMTWRSSEAAVNAAFDRSLYGAIRAIDANVSTDSGGVGVELPYVMFELFELTASGAVFYRVATEDGLVEIGSPDLPMPAGPLATRQPYFETAMYVDGPVRIGTYVRPIERPLAHQPGTRLVIQVAEDLSSRKSFSRQFIWSAVTRDLLLALFAAGMVAAAVTWSLRPLRQLRTEVQSRAPDDLSPVETARVPADVLPLVEAMNQHVFRYRDLLAAQRQFLDDASHQLRTPLATLLMQVTFAQREPDAGKVHEALQAIRVQLRHTIRQVNQMLALARADASSDQPTAPVDLAALARGVTTRWWSAARERGIDLGYEAPTSPLRVRGRADLLEEALSNLLDNALRHAPAGGRVTVQVVPGPGTACIHVSDNGPGIPEDELPRATERFFRASNTQGSGSGLGLAIVQSIVKRHRGQLHLAREPNEGGLRATIELARDEA